MWLSEYYNFIQVAYLKGQVALVPLYALMFLVPARGFKLQTRINFHNGLLLGSLLFPAFLLLFDALPKPSFPSTPATVAAIHLHSAVNHALLIPAGYDAYRFSSAITVIGILCFAFLMARQVFQEHRLRRHAERQIIRGRVLLVFSPLILSPFSTGIFRAFIYCPARLLENRKHLAPILHHEAAHIRRSHLAWALLDKLHVALGWYNPLAFLLMRKGIALREYDCDQTVLKTYSPNEYGRILINEAETLARAGKWALSSAFIGPKLFKRRFTMLFERQSVEQRKGILTIAALLVLLSGLLVAIFSFSGNRPRTVTLKGYESPSGYQLVKSEMKSPAGRQLYEEWNPEAEGKVALYYPGRPAREKQLNGRDLKSADSVWATAMPVVLPKIMTRYPVDTASSIMRMGHMLMRLTIAPDGSVTQADIQSYPEDAALTRELESIEKGLNFGINPSGRESIIPFTLAFSCAYIRYPAN